MRRGGKNYYALDVSDRDKPVLLWTIKGGSGDFVELAETWSAATHAKIKVSGVATDVLVFGGGYDINQDSNEKSIDDNEGRAIFIVDAKTGAKIWQAGPPGSAAGGADPDLVLPQMTNSIPADIAVIDTNSDGLHDRLYVGDMRAQLWRIDLNNENSGASKLAKDINGDDMGGIIAKLGDGGKTHAKDNRRFYSQPDVSLSTTGQYYNIAIGSGYRAHPLDLDIHDSFYMVRDPFTMDQIRNRVTTDLYITPDGTLGLDGTMFDATDYLFTGTDEVIATARASLSKSYGCYIKLDDRSKTDTFIGEKSLSKSLTFGGEVLFSTYTPTASSSASSCSPSQGQARLYTVNIEDCTPTHYEGDPERIERETQLIRGGIPPEPTIIISDDEVTILVGTEDVKKDPPRLINKTYWRQN